MERLLHRFLWRTVHFRQGRGDENINITDDIVRVKLKPSHSIGIDFLLIRAATIEHNECFALSKDLGQENSVHPL